MIEATLYDDGYASIDPRATVGPNAAGLPEDSPAWGRSSILLQLGWLGAQLARDPSDQFKWGRYDALCDALVALGPVMKVPVPAVRKTRRRRG